MAGLEKCSSGGACFRIPLAGNLRGRRRQTALGQQRSSTTISTETAGPLFASGRNIATQHRHPQQMLNDLPQHMRQAVDFVLLPGESVRWKARPMRQNWFAPAFGGVATLLGVFIISLSANLFTEQPIDANTRLAAWFVTGLGLFILLAGLRAVECAKNSVYLITDRRILDIEATNAEPFVEVYLPPDIQYRKKHVYRDGLDDLYFTRALTQSGNSGWAAGDKGFKRAGDAAGAERAIDALIWPGLDAHLHAASPAGDAASQAWLTDFSPYMREIVNAELRPGEQIAWAAQPIRHTFAADCKEALWVLRHWQSFRQALEAPLIGEFVAIGIFMAVIDSILLALFLHGIPGLPLLLTSIGALLFYALAWFLVRFFDGRKYTAYVVTSLRAIHVFAPRQHERTVWSALPQEIKITKKTLKLDGSGTILFVHDTASNGKITRTSDNGFENVPGVGLLEINIERLASHA